MTRYRTIFILLAITVLSYLSVSIFYKTVNAKLTAVKTWEVAEAGNAPSGDAGKPSLASYGIITKRNLFGSTRKGNSSIPFNVDELEKTKLDLNLLGTVYGEGEFDCAVIEDKKKQELFRVGDRVAGAEVVRILRGSVILRVNGKDEVLLMKEDTSGKGNDTGSESTDKRPITVSKTALDKAFGNMGEMLTQARIRPHFDSGAPDGFMISRIKQGSLFQKMGLNNGDVIQGVNGSSLGSAEEMFKLYKQMKTGSQVVLNIKRRGKEQTLEYLFGEDTPQ